MLRRQFKTARACLQDRIGLKVPAGHPISAWLLEHCSTMINAATKGEENAMEPRAAIGEYDPFEDRYTLHAGNQFPHDIRSWLAGGRS